jgi:hypothetical protein
MPYAETTGGVNVTLPVGVADLDADEVVIEPGHLERLFRTGCYVAIRDGLLRPGEEAVARLVPGSVRTRHGAIDCLESCRVELVGASGALLATVEFPRVVFAAFAVARGVHLLLEAGRPLDTAIAYSVHAIARDDAEPFPLAIPALPPISVAALTRDAVACGTPADDWVATFVTPAVTAGIDELERSSRASGVETAGRIHSRVGFDPERRTFVRILDQLVIARATKATAASVVSTGASWGEFLAVATTPGPRAPSSVHSHLHLDGAADPVDGVQGNHLLGGGRGLAASHATCISINDILSHYVNFPDPLSAALIVSLFPDTRVLTLYGYTQSGLLREESGYWRLEREGMPSAEVMTDA